MVELNDIEMKEVDSTNASNTTNSIATPKEEKKDANTLTLDGEWRFSEEISIYLKEFRSQRSSSND
jgi:hypothetical protein